jgi:hypothetical protein
VGDFVVPHSRAEKSACMGHPRGVSYSIDLQVSPLHGTIKPSRSGRNDNYIVGVQVDTAIG